MHVYVVVGQYECLEDGTGEGEEVDFLLDVYRVFAVREDAEAFVAQANKYLDHKRQLGRFLNAQGELITADIKLLADRFRALNGRSERTRDWNYVAMEQLNQLYATFNMSDDALLNNWPAIQDHLRLDGRWATKHHAFVEQRLRERAPREFPLLAESGNFNTDEIDDRPYGPGPEPDRLLILERGVTGHLPQLQRQQVLTPNGAWTVLKKGKDICIVDPVGRERYRGCGHLTTAVHLAMQLAEHTLEPGPGDKELHQRAKEFAEQ